MTADRRSLLIEQLKNVGTGPAAKKLRENEEVVSRLLSIGRTDPMICTKVFELCRSYLEETEKVPEKGWLNELYVRLVNHLFPDDAHPDRPLTKAQRLYLAVLEVLIEQLDDEFDPLLDVLPFDRGALTLSRVRKEFQLFEKTVDDSHFLALMRMTREVTPFDIASHMIGVHNIALHTGIMAKKAGFSVDLPLLSAAAIAHDIGKYGCRGDEASKVPYFHYYYTWQWFCDNGMENIGYISANHSTWDLEFENLPIESLLLVYADFRVRGRRDENGRELITIHTLDEAYDIIFGKLANMTEEKRRRYLTVYIKLRDFERMLKDRGVPSELSENTLLPVKTKDASLMSARETLGGLRSATLRGSVELMETVSVAPSFTRLLEQAKTEKTHQQIRTYLSLFREYSTYMVNANKKKLLLLLYELLVHPDGDVRREAGEIMGEVLAGSGPKYRKERPGGAHQKTMTPTMIALLDESVELWKHYLGLCLHPDRKYSPKHAFRIRNSLKIICQTLFTNCEEKDAEQLIRPLLDEVYKAKGLDRFAMVDSLCRIPIRLIPQRDYYHLLKTLEQFLSDAGGNVELKIAVLQYLQQLKEIPALVESIRTIAVRQNFEKEYYEWTLTYLKNVILEEPYQAFTDEQRSKMFLTNQKNAVHWKIKMAQIGLLCEEAKRNASIAFRTALHFSNLLCVSEHVPVRESAGEHLIEIAPLLSVDQANEIAYDILREMETGEDQIIRFIPPYIGRFLRLLPRNQLNEAIDVLEKMTQGAAIKTACVGLEAVGALIVTRDEKEDPITFRLLSILMTGISHYEDQVHQTAMWVLCYMIFGNKKLPYGYRRKIFLKVNKKLLTLLSEKRRNRLTSFNRSAMLNHLYRFIVEYEVNVGDFVFEKQKPVAFFPGTFDPFSEGHKKVVEKIREMGFEVYLAIDEFSWSKKTVPKLLRRQIAAISTADQWDTYIFPDDMPINIAMPDDLKKLKSVFSRRPLYLVVGSDVILHASAYRNEKPDGAREYNHIVFCRDKEHGGDEFSRIIKGEVLAEKLPEFYETVSSTRIRDYVDRKMDISMLVNPIVQTYIYDRALYVRAPETKGVLPVLDMVFKYYPAASDEVPVQLRKEMIKFPDSMAAALTVRRSRKTGWVIAHTVGEGGLMGVLPTREIADKIRRSTAGSLLFIDSIRMPETTGGGELARMALNELLARNLESHTYAMCLCAHDDRKLKNILTQIGFVEAPGCRGVWLVDMRMPIAFVQDLKLQVKKPSCDDPVFISALERTRPKMRKALAGLFPGQLVLCFDSELLNQRLMERVHKSSGAFELEDQKSLAAKMCVPYGRILSDTIVPQTVTKSLHVEKYFHQDLRQFDIREYPDYSPLRNQVKVLKSFHRPVLLVDDVLHNGYRIDKLDTVFREEEFSPEKIIVAVMSGRGRDLMRQQDRKVECEYYIPNLHYWIKESLLYLFVGGDSMENRPIEAGMLPSINLILPYCYPHYMQDAPEKAVINFSAAALENAWSVMQALEQIHQKDYDTTLTIGRLGEVIARPRLPEQNSSVGFDFNMPASLYLEEEMILLERICKRDK